VSNIVPGDTPEEIAQRHDERMREQELARLMNDAMLAASTSGEKRQPVNVVRVTLIVILILAVIAMVVLSA
jgi:hypothetical protein